MNKFAAFAGGLLFGTAGLKILSSRDAKKVCVHTTAAVLRAAEIGADAILLAKNIDGVYSADPRQDPSAVKYDAITYDEVLAQHLAVMDSTATSLAMDNNIPVFVFALSDPENIVRAVCGEAVGTIVTK